MKKLLLLTIITLISFISCNDNDVIANENTINPPEWIQGTWFLENYDKTSGYKFTNDDFCLLSLRSQLTCFKETVNSTASSTLKTEIIQKSTNNSYRIEITLASQTSIYEFKKIDANKIEWVNDPLGEQARTYYIK